MMSFRKSLAGALALSLLAFASASADPAPAAAGGAAGGAAAPVTPSETKPFGDWTVRCFPVKTPSPCDMFELLANKKTGQRVMSVSIAYLPGTDRHVIQIAVPLGVMIQKGLVLSSDTFTAPVFHYRRCDRGGCYVEMVFDNQAVDALKGSTSAKIEVVALGGKTFDIPFSLNGFGDAHGAMVDLARKKTGSSAPSDATPPAPAASGATTPAPDNSTPDQTPSTTP